MSPDYPLEYQAATPEYVLDVLRTSFPRLSWETPADEVIFFASEDSADATGLAKLFNTAFRIQVPPNEWSEAFLNSRNRTVRELCKFIAQHARRPAIRPWRHVAGDCLPAGAFLTVRSMLVRLGARPDQVTPSTPLRSILPRFADTLIWELQLLAPANLPQYSETRRLKSVGWAVLAVSLALGGLGVALTKLGVPDPVLALVGLMCFGVVLGTLLYSLGMILPPSRVTFGNLHTFRDLAYALAGQDPRRRIQPTA